MEFRPIHHWLAKSLDINITEPPYLEDDATLLAIHQKWEHDMQKLNEAVNEFESVMLSSILHKMSNDQGFKNQLKSLLK